jgi:hypothetical protein
VRVHQHQIHATRKRRSRLKFARVPSLEGRLCESLKHSRSAYGTAARGIHTLYNNTHLMLPLATRRFVARCARAPSPFLRYASTKPDAKPSVKQQITKAFTNPAPPVLARYPIIYWPVRIFIWAIGLNLAWHIWCEYFYTLSLAEGISMSPTMNATGDWLLLSKTYRRGRGIEVGDIVSFRHPIDEGTSGVKRVVAMPGDFVLRDSPGTSGAMIQVSEHVKSRTKVLSAN